jgi:hypothetical protein
VLLIERVAPIFLRRLRRQARAIPVRKLRLKVMIVMGVRAEAPN